MAVKTLQQRRPGSISVPELRIDEKRRGTFGVRTGVGGHASEAARPQDIPKHHDIGGINIFR
jgi:hypothetical protein